MTEPKKHDIINDNINLEPRYPNVKVFFRQKYNYRRPIIHQLFDFQITDNTKDICISMDNLISNPLKIP